MFSRLTTDAGLTALLASAAGGIYQEMLPYNAQTPAVTFTIEANTPSDSFRAMVRVMSVQVSVWIERQPATDAGIPVPMDYAQGIINRIIGNWPTKAAGIAPDFGLDRWTPAVLSPWAFSMMAHTDTRENHTDEFLQYVLIFTVVATRGAV